MLRLIRTLVYKLGFRPKPGTILHSPSRALLEVGHEINEIVMKDIREAQKSNPPHILADSYRIMRLDDPTRETYDLIKRCCVCGSVMRMFFADIKECPEGHGRAYPAIDNHGLPVITFEPTDGT